jgi:hypothetical protein
MYCLIFLLDQSVLVTELMARLCIIEIEINFNIFYVILCFLLIF